MGSSKMRLLPFLFQRERDHQVLLVNQCGDFLFVTPGEFESILADQIVQGSDLYYKLKGRLFLADDADLTFQTDRIADQLRTRKAFLNDFTSLHMVVVTCRCNFHCKYCHASSSDQHDMKLDMTWKVARKTVEKIFSSPSRQIKIEFQGGEPLLNWKMIQNIVEYAEILNRFSKRDLEFVICTNLTLATEDILNYCKKHHIYISTSLDGNKDIQNANRISRDQKDGYEEFLKGLQLARHILGNEACSALVTVTRTNLKCLDGVIDEYIRMGFQGIFIRELNPYGYAVSHFASLGYSTEEFIRSYKNALNYIIDQNLKGHFFVEYYAALILKRILTPFPTGFVDMQFPCGNVIGGAIYDYDGNVYASDEGRMLARMGDRKFLLGNVLTDRWEDIFKGDKARAIVKCSCMETLPGCSWCAYQMYCGSDPVRYYTECGDLSGKRSDSNFCKKNKDIIGYIFYLLGQRNDDINDVFWSWLTGRPLEALRQE